MTGFLALAVAGRTSDDPQLVRASYLAMEVVGWYVIVPLCGAALITGLLHVLQMGPVVTVADDAGKSMLDRDELNGLRLQLIADRRQSSCSWSPRRCRCQAERQNALRLAEAGPRRVAPNAQQPYNL